MINKRHVDSAHVKYEVMIIVLKFGTDNPWLPIYIYASQVNNIVLSDLKESDCNHCYHTQLMKC